MSGTAAIITYLAPPSLKGSSTLHEAQVLQWLNLSEYEILPAVLALVDSSPAAKSAFGRARQEVQYHVDALNKLLLTRTYLVGEVVSAADVAVTCVLLPAFTNVFDGPARSKSSNVMRWFSTVVNQPNVKNVVGDVKFFEGKSSKH